MTGYSQGVRRTNLDAVQCEDLVERAAIAAVADCLVQLNGQISCRIHRVLEHSTDIGD